MYRAGSKTRIAVWMTIWPCSAAMASQLVHTFEISLQLGFNLEQLTKLTIENVRRPTRFSRLLAMIAIDAFG
jgi:hypothetical protein